MPSLVITDLPEDLYRRLQQRAAAHGRSLGEEALALLAEALRERPREEAVEATLARARRLRAITAAHPLTDQALHAAKTQGRP